MSKSEPLQSVELDKIDPNIIKTIRPVHEKTIGFKALEAAINSNEQRHPIIIRRLSKTEFESPQLKAGAIYGIIDGHHRYRIAQKNNNDTILSTIISDDVSEDVTQTKLNDVKLALQMNSAIPMSTIQKGKIIHELENETGKTVIELGEELFGIAKSMAYRCVNAYKKYENIKTVKKSRDKTFDYEFLNEIKNSLKQIPVEQSEIDINNPEKCLQQIEILKNLENKLKHFRQMLQNQKSVVVLNNNSLNK